MSNAEKQIAVMLMGVCSCMVVLHTRKAFSRVDMKNLVHEIYDQISDKALPMWTGKVIYEKQLETLTNMVQAWEAAVGSEEFDTAEPTVVSAAALQLLEDTLVHTKNIVRRDMLEDLKVKVEFLYDFCDRSGANFPALELATSWVKPMYEITGWENS